MSARSKLALAFSLLLASAALPLFACSSSEPRDLNWGTDAEADFVPPDAGLAQSKDTGNPTSDGDSVDSEEVASTPTVDAGEGIVDAEAAADSHTLDADEVVDSSASADN